MQDKLYEVIDNSKNILVYAYARIGDAAITLILLDNLIDYFKDKKFYVICSERNLEIFKFNEYLADIFIWPTKLDIKKANIDFVIFLAGIDNKRDFILYRFLRENLTNALFLGYVKNKLEGYGFDICIYHAKKGSIIERISNLTKLLTRQKDLIQPHITIPQDVEEEIQRVTQVDNRSQKVIHLNISAGDKTSLRSYFSRNLPLSILEKLINFLNKQNIICLVTAAPWDKEKFQYLKSKYVKLTNILFIDTPSLSHLIAVIKMSEIVITPETSVIHIASVLDKKIIGVYDSVKKFKEWPPWSKTFSVIVPKIPRFMPSLDFKKLCNLITNYL